VRIAVLVLGVSALPCGTALAQKQDLEEGERAFDRGQLERAARAYDRAIREYPGQVPAGAYGKRAAIYILGRDYAAGLRFIEQVAALRHPDAPAVLEQKALILWALGRRAPAIAVAEKVAAARPETFAVQQLIGRYYSQSKPDRAIKALTTYFAHRPRDLAGDDALPRLRLGFAHLATGDPAGATRQFELVLSRFRGDRIARVNATNGLCAAHAAASRYDAAIAVCSRITARPADVDARGSVWYNLARAYLGKRRHRDARRAARRYIQARPEQGKGYLLVGDALLGERKPKAALRQFLAAEKRTLSSVERAQLGIRLGVTYRRLGQIDRAVARLDQALARDPENAELRLELAGALLSAASAERSKARRTALDRRAAQVAILGFRHASGARLLELRIAAGRAEYNLGRLSRAEAHYRAARAAAPGAARVRVGLTRVINKQAAAAFAAGDRKKAATLSRAALEITPRSPTAHRNLAVLMIADGQCAAARPHVEALAKIRSQALAYHRLGARVALCDKRRAAALDHYTAAAEVATRTRDNLGLAAVYTEWAPLLPDEQAAVDKLEQAVQLAGRRVELKAAASRNLAVALYRRGWKRLASRDAAGAGADFDRALADASVLRGAEPLAVELSLGIAKLSTDPRIAADTFRALAGRGKPASYLEPRYAALGAPLFAAYASYRAGTRAELDRAAAAIRRLAPKTRGDLAELLRDLAAAVAIASAADQHRRGDAAAARRDLFAARRQRPGAAVSRVIAHNLAVLDMARKPAAARAALDKLGGRPAKALVNLGILADRRGEPKAAFDLWTRAQRANAGVRDLSRWIATKKRMFGF
jgi:tetratricopeptide (TPR) repeat protein